MKKRLDLLVLERGLAESREKAKTLIMAGQVYVDQQKADKPGDLYPEDAQIEARGKALPFVSRGGLKLEKARREFQLSLEGLTCMDVGYGQLAWSLRSDPRVVNLERTNARYLTREQVPEAIDFFSVDVSFISLSLILPAVRPLLAEQGRAVCLIKPQFEAGREKVGKKGVVREKSTHLEVIRMVMDFAESLGFEALNLEFSPIKGPEGNIEYLLYLQNRPEGYESREAGEIRPEQVVEEAHRSL